MYTLYGDGIHDDTLAIQELIDSGVCEVQLPAPKKYYLISKPLVLPSNFRLVLPRYAEIRLAPGSNCLMLKNKMVPNYAPRLQARALPENLSPVAEYMWRFIDEFDPDSPCENIEICGGIWNFNNMQQAPNMHRIRALEPREIDYTIRDFYAGGMLFYNIKGFKAHDLTLKDPTCYGMTLDTVSYFTVENIDFDYNTGNPVSLNMDGIHINGNSHYGHIRNLKGTCYDDLVALNSEEGSHGPITHITVDGLYAENCHSAIRLLCLRHKVEHIHITNVHGTYYQYTVGITKHYKGDATGGYDAITIDNIYAAKCRRVSTHPNPNKPSPYTPLWVSHDTVVKNLTVRDLHRRETADPLPTVFVGKNTVIDRFVLENVSTENYTQTPMPLLENNGTIKHLSAANLRTDKDEIFAGEGEILHLEQK